MHQSKWNNSNWETVSDNILKHVEPGLDAIASHNRRIDFYKLDEPIWFGIHDPVVLSDVDKGRTAARILGKKPNVLTLGVISDPNNKKKAANIREYTSQPGLSSEAIQRIFESENVIFDIDDFGKVPALMKSMATRELMERSDQQVEAQIDRLFGSSFDYPLAPGVEQRIYMNTPAGVVDEKLKYYLRRYNHMRYVLEVSLGIPKRLCETLFNIHIFDQPIHIYQSELEEAKKQTLINL